MNLNLNEYSLKDYTLERVKHSKIVFVKLLGEDKEKIYRTDIPIIENDIVEVDVSSKNRIGVATSDSIELMETDILSLLNHFDCDADEIYNVVARLSFHILNWLSYEVDKRLQKNDLQAIKDFFGILPF